MTRKPRNDRRERSRIILSNNDTVCFFYFFPLFQIVISPHVRGVPLNEGVDEEADKVLADDLGIEHLYWLFRYDRASDFHKLVYAIKYRSNRELGVWAGKMLGERMKDVRGIDCIIPVPLHPEREKKRGFNQAFLIGTGIASVLGGRIEPEVLRRVVNTPSQTGLERGQRADNVVEALRADSI